MKANFRINLDDMFYPESKKWMFDYCVYLGKFRDSEGNDFDLGIHIDSIDGEVSGAIVGSNEPGDYWSGGFTPHEVERRAQRTWHADEKYIETFRRANILHLININKRT